MRRRDDRTRYEYDCWHILAAKNRQRVGYDVLEAVIEREVVKISGVSGRFTIDYTKHFTGWDELAHVQQAVNNRSEIAALVVEDVMAIQQAQRCRLRRT